MLHGETFTRRGQRYRCVGRLDYETRDGRWIDLFELESVCPDCGSAFVCLATRKAARRSMLRLRCDSCRAPGVPVKPADRSRVLRRKKFSRRHTLQQKHLASASEAPTTLAALLE